MCTQKFELACVVPAGTVSGPQDRTPAVIEQGELQPVPWSATTQFRPGFVGSVSVSVVLYASPLPEFQTVILKPIWSPAFTGVASAVFRMWIAGAATQISADESSEPSFVVDT